MQVSALKPDAVKLDKFLLSKKDLDFSYPEIGETPSGKPDGYDLDHNSICLGNGEMIWKTAKTALVNWQQFPSSWTQVYPVSTPIRKGEQVAVLSSLFGFWVINATRIVYAFDESDRFGFAYGTLPGHVERGEECFWIERDAEGDVYYHIRAFSKPAFWVVKLGYPIARYFQKKFVKGSLARMKSLSNYNLQSK